jgi:hypothetical protein
VSLYNKWYLTDTVFNVAVKGNAWMSLCECIYSVCKYHGCIFTCICWHKNGLVLLCICISLLLNRTLGRILIVTHKLGFCIPSYLVWVQRILSRT